MKNIKNIKTENPFPVLPKTGKYGNMEMKDDEFLIGVQVALNENNDDMREALADTRCIDALLKIKKLHRAVHVHVKRTGQGHVRKGIGFFDNLEKIIEGRMEGSFYDY